MAVGEIFLAAFVQVLLETLTRRDFLDYVGRLGGVGKKLLKWEKMLSAVAAVLYDAEEKQLTSKSVELWLNDLKHLAYDIDDLLHTFSNEMLERDRQVRGFFTKVPHKIKFNYNMNSEIKEIDDRLEAIFDRKKKLGLKYIEHTSSSSHRTPGSYVLDGPVIGRDEDKRKIVELLSRDVDSPTNYQVVAIVGMGGLGKSTLAGQVFNDAAAMEQFDLKIWVSVSDDFNLETVTKVIFRKVTSQPCDNDDLSDVQHHLSTKINGKRFLIVLDDVWSTCDYVSWTKLQASFRSGAQGSKVMVTTRDEKVAALMGAPAAAVYHLKTLSDETCLELVEQHANNDRPPNFELLKKKIVTNCKGLPLAAKVLGGVLRCEDTGNWEKILDDKLWSTSDKSEILPVLRLSYQYLPSTLKRCFAYCSILPNDYEFGKDELICLWMAEGFLEQSDGSNSMEDIGNEYFGELLSRSLLQKPGKSSSLYGMHDLIGDLARWAAGDTYSRLDDKPQGGCSLKTRHMAYISGKFDGRKRFETVSDAKHLRSFLPFSVTNGNENYLTHYVASDLLLKLKYLRVLSFRGYKLTEVPDSVGNVRLLRYLNLSGTLIMSLPESICTLYNLQTLMLVNCSNLKTLPSNLSNLSNLRHLYNSNTPSLEEMPPQVSRLTHLRTLSKFVVGNADSAPGIGEIGSLTLHGDLSIGRLENVIDVGDAQRAKINNKEGLDTLNLEWSGTGEKELEVLCSLEPHKKLQQLSIKGYNGFEFSKWIGHPSFSDMTLVRLENCKNCRSLPPLGQLPNLKSLHIEGLASVESVDAEFYGDGSLPFPVLETLGIINMPVWKKWLPCKRNEENSVFPCLRELAIFGCPKLKNLLPNNIDSLSALAICECEQLVVSMANYKHLCMFIVDGCKRLVNRSGVKFELLEDMVLRSIPVFRLEIDGFIRGLTKLKWLKITGGEELTSLWESEDRWLQHRISDIVGGSVSQSPRSHFVQHLRSLNQLEIVGCSNLICFPDCDMLRSLNRLEIVGCSNLICFSDCGLPPSLEYLKIESCDSLAYLVKFQLPSGIRMIVIAKCQNLRVLVKDAEGCSSSSCCLEALSINECASFTSLSGNGGRLPRTLKYLWIIACEQLESIMETFHEDTCLEYIEIEKCANLKSLPEGLCHLSVLHTLMIGECGSLVSFPRGGLPSNLARLSINQCDQLEALPRGIDNCSSLQTLEMGYCEGLSSILEEGFPPNLISLLIIFPKSLKPLSEWGLHHWDRLASLTELKLAGVDSDMVSFPPKTMLLPKSLIKLCIGGFPNLKRLSSSFQSLTSLESLDIFYCPKLASAIPEQADHLPLSLTQLRIYGFCPLLWKRYQPGKGRYWREVAYIPYVSFGDDDDDDEAEVDHPHN
ncbi:putative disease resistance RPP13-like protein 1 [Argentina anserina]|uniref:putative disease resistance RPP13-like protein 1 n=1 Tax=Argentina anserina TaxID=57926 RepID=UPI002176429E|nr:putative disease resistance RPP13-like protein 1 [Potentilla anserina]XP_050378132.1 putative disease resistance RPP13-like protein 1 [Potentilla anserina]XP_050378133.1 putative disease resistance RPP13-like protein 1 [Potentilla anserina]XP_050378134.1 putative disease resistance RPP13-like protein 1 [Potentilla anserina]XP_050378135.1 putative disease resistance RPP13-like protein 1 [Potentilla anserina]XP_050378136.1 putative disease resistance RPP13-like protein 1 [Potentilla anserina]